jgi:hypothetical protein
MVKEPVRDRDTNPTHGITFVPPPELKAAKDKYVKKLHPTSPGEYDQSDIIMAFYAGWTAHEELIEQFRCPICKRLNCGSDHGY